MRPSRTRSRWRSSSSFSTGGAKIWIFTPSVGDCCSYSCGVTNEKASPAPAAGLLAAASAGAGSFSEAQALKANRLSSTMP